jgi:lipopolysaccharide transport system permease protein
VRSDFKNRVSRSRLGFLWLIIAPLSQVLIYAFVLSALMTQKLPGISSSYAYAIYLMAGFQGWFLFLEIFNRSSDRVYRERKYNKENIISYDPPYL